MGLAFGRLARFLQTSISSSVDADVMLLAVVPDQTVTSTTFNVQIAAEAIDPSVSITAPTVSVNGGGSVAMNITQLQWPGTSIDSVNVWSANVTLASNQSNNLVVTSGNKTLPFAIRHRSALTVQTATSAGDLQTKAAAAITNNNIDVIEIGYNETDLGLTLHGVNPGNNITSTRTNFLTIKPASGFTAVWNKDHATSMRRPFIDLLKLENVTFGSDTSDATGGLYYVELTHRVWCHNVQFRGQYKYTWAKSTPAPYDLAQYDFRVVTTEKVYFTSCVWDGTATVSPVASAVICRDGTFNSHRGDFNNFGKLFLNCVADDVRPIRNYTNTDYTHNDGFQIWGTTNVTNIIFKGFKVKSSHVPSELQPYLLDSTFSPDYQNIIIDSLYVDSASAGTNLKAQNAGKITNARISNISAPGQSMTLRCDLVGTNAAFAPANVYFNNLTFRDVNYLGSPSNVNYDVTNVSNPNDISTELSSIATISSGATFTNFAISSDTMRIVTATVSGTTVTITWSTTAGGTSGIEFGLTTAYGTAVLNGNETNVTNHTVVINSADGLEVGKMYHFRVNSSGVYSNDYVFSV